MADGESAGFPEPVVDEGGTLLCMRSIRHTTHGTIAVQFCFRCKVRPLPQIPRSLACLADGDVGSHSSSSILARGSVKAEQAHGGGGAFLVSCWRWGC